MDGISYSGVFSGEGLILGLQHSMIVFLGRVSTSSSI